METDIRLSSSEFKALASETRAGIIKLLRERNHTLTELSKKLRLAAPTVKQHLGILQTAEIIQELDEGRKWKYYSLTRKGKNMFSPETPVNIFIVLGITVIALVGTLYSFLSAIESRVMLYASNALPRGEALIGTAEKEAGDYTVQATEAAANAWQTAFPDMHVTAFLLAIVGLSLIAGYLIAKASPGKKK